MTRTQGAQLIDKKRQASRNENSVQTKTMSKEINKANAQDTNQPCMSTNE